MSATARLCAHLTALASALLAMSATFEVLAHGTEPPRSETTRHIQFPDTADRLTLVLDPHTHTVFSDGHVWPKIRVGEALLDGLDAYAVTEHLEYQPHRADIPQPDRNRAFQQAAEAADGTDLLVIPGTEITREAPAGHMNALFVSDANAMLNPQNPPADQTDVIGYYIAANQWPAEEAVAAAVAQNAFIFWNHPNWTRQQPDGIAVLDDFHARMIKAGSLHGIEIANGDQYSEEAFAIALKHNLALIGVSDVHDLIDWDYEPHNGGHRPVTLVLATERSQAGIRAALFERRTAVYFKNMLFGRERELQPLISASLEVTQAVQTPQTDLVAITLQNHSDLPFTLQNTSRHTLMETTDLVSVPAHESVTVSVKPDGKPGKVNLKFKILNALTAPGRPYELSYAATIEMAPHKEEAQ